ncbi:LuxR C-terminal-related transcriptional regulator [Pseudarthrobacter sp. R1]|uniref:LuxR C-terminal-related transcriptional regulator n=1 Tax=Pseudarthrobacter sp. R1 TaxID=2944934 RepID=UPI00210E5F0F|nr:LuxR C-terminal-related transcriptional regulator [Pseudarthrobacter sp. R1]MCQ6272331.1 LuxR C-terminal-related transcriptional regulator [Pseudarthrobacter sp. R1]
MSMLATKFHVPAPRRHAVARPRLVDPLLSEARADRKLTLICAPAGFGKTTLLSQWVHRVRAAEPEVRVAWLSLDDGDNDPARFLTHLIAGIHGVDATIGSGAKALLDATQAAAAEPVLVALINDLAQVGTTFIVVLDDYHAVEAHPVHDAVAFLLDHSPPQLQLAIASRSDPPLPLSRLRARDQMTELRAADLRFSAKEAQAFLNECMGLGLSAEHISALEARTEGWAAGLQLAALSLRGNADVPGFIDAFTGSNRFILDYLVEEVLQHQPDGVRNFLMRSAILDRLSGPLCDAVTGQGGSSAVLDHLERANLFVVPLDDRRQWYRYHHLFAEVLRARVSHEEPDLQQSLHRRASEWYQHHDLLEDALKHALAAGDFERAGALLEAVMPAIRKSRQDATLRGWLNALPDHIVRANPVLSVFYAWLMLTSGDLDAVEQRLQDAERGLAEASRDGERTRDLRTGLKAGSEEFRALPVTIAVYRAALAQAVGDVAGTAAHARRALVLCGPDDHLSRAAAAGFLGLAAWARGDLDTAVPTFAEVAPNLRAAGNIADELASTMVLADLWIARGSLTEARRLLEQALTAADSAGISAGPPTADLHVGISALNAETGDLAAAKEQLAAGIALGEAASLPENRYRRFVVKARLEYLRGDPDRAIGLLEEAERRYLRGFFPEVRPILAIKARIWIGKGALREAWDWARARNLTAGDDLTYLREFEHLTLARLLIAQHEADPPSGSLGDAFELLERLLQAAQTAGRGGSVNEILVLKARASQVQGGLGSALEALEQALKRTAAESHVRLFLDEGEPMIALLRRAAVEHICPSYVSHLLHAANTGATAPATSHGTYAMPVQLSERELQVLRMLDSSLSGPEVARQLFVSLNTLRTHTRHIFEKLQVNNRAEAVRCAREHGLL